MNLLKFITDHWAQITILIAAGGYFLKIVLDYKFKQKEIWYTLYSQKKMEFLLKYLELYYKVESKTLGIISVLKTGKINDLSRHEELDVLSLVNLYAEAGQQLNYLEFFIGRGKYEYLKQAHVEIGQKMQALNNLLQKRNQDEPLINEFESLYQQTLNVIHKHNVKLFSHRKSL